VVETSIKRHPLSRRIRFLIDAPFWAMLLYRNRRPGAERFMLR